MRDSWFRHFAPARILGPAVFLLATILLPQPAPAAEPVGTQAGDHAAALAALSDVRAAIALLVDADMSYSTNRNTYHSASRRAINALEGLHGPDAVASLGSPGDAEGALGHIDALLDRKATPVWVTPLHGAEANLRGAIVYLRDSLKARELMDYEITVSRALTYLEVAEGRPTGTGVLAGLEGALANTTLGIPGGATQEDACAGPRSAPAYGTHDGSIAWITVPIAAGVHALAQDPGSTTVTVQGNMIVLHTAAAAQVQKACGSHAMATPAMETAVATAPPGQPQVAPQPKPQQQAAAAPTAAPAQGSAPPALYTVAQAQAGAAVFASKCVSCHGGNMQGTAAPSVAGNDFLNTAKHNGWTLSAIRYLVFNIMPFNAPRSLSPQAYANVMAFLLASNCYPAGNTPFPTEDQASFANIKLGPVPGTTAKQNSLGVCKVP